jgi:hypothetical protein
LNPKKWLNCVQRYYDRSPGIWENHAGKTPPGYFNLIRLLLAA